MEYKNRFYYYFDENNKNSEFYQKRLVIFMSKVPYNRTEIQTETEHKKKYLDL